jgi:hypothetical protein
MALLDTVHDLAVGIGPRPAGSSAELAACELLATKVAAGERPVQRHEFTYRGWQGGDRGAVRIDGLDSIQGWTWPYTLPSGQDCTGTLVYGGSTIVIRGRLEVARFDLVADGRALGRILVVPSEEVRPTPNPSPWDALPTLVVGSEHRSKLVDASASGARVSLVTDGTEMLAHGTNLVLPPAAAITPRIVVIAHYDTVPESPGANDNAGGVAVLEELTRRLRPSAPVVFVLSTAEELWFVGARALVARFQDERVIDDLAGCIAIDMVGVGEAICLRAPGRSKWAAAAAGNTLIESVVRHTPATDHVPFHDIGVDAVQITRLGDAEYHSRDDSLERVSEAALGDVVDVVDGLITSVLVALPPVRA